MFNWRSFLPFILTLGFSPLIDDFVFKLIRVVFFGTRLLSIVLLLLETLPVVGLAFDLRGI